MSKLIVSASGIRGIIGDTLTPEVAIKIGQAYGTWVGKGPVIIGGDTRVSYDVIKNAVLSGLLAVGTDVIDIGKVTTPTVQQMIRHHKAKGGIVITASHNPIMWNGIKLMNDTGAFLEGRDFEDYLKIEQDGNFQLASWNTIGKIVFYNQALENHVDIVLSKLDTKKIRSAGLRVLVDANNGTGALADPILFDRLGVTYEIMNSEPNGRFAHEPEPLKKNLTEISARLANGGFDIGFAQDPDADRLVILDENGTFIGEDYSLALCVDYLLSKSSTPDKKVVVNLSTSLVIEWIAKKYGAALFYTRIGEPNVTAKIKEVHAEVGGEGNGGVIYPKVGWGRDSLVGIVAALLYLAESKKTVSQIVRQYPAYVMLREKIMVSDREAIQAVLEKAEFVFPDAKINKDDGIKIILENAWVHVRPSNTEPIVRIFIEAESEEKANYLFDQVQDKLKQVRVV